MQHAILISILLLSCLHTSIQIGDFFGEINGGIRGILLTEESKDIDIGTFKYFGIDESLIKIYRNGVIGIGTDANLPTPSYNGLNTQGKRFVAPSWVNYESGEVKYLIKQNTENDADFKKMADEINRTFNKEITSADIDKVVIITWYDMKFHNIIQSPLISNDSFQVALSILHDSNEAFVHIIYRKIDIKLAKVKAIVGVGDTFDINDFKIGIYFPFRDDWVQYFSNIPNYKSLGRYLISLSVPFVDQKSQPGINCVDNPEPICTGTS